MNVDNNGKVLHTPRSYWYNICFAVTSLFTASVFVSLLLAALSYHFFCDLLYTLLTVIKVIAFTMCSVYSAVINNYCSVNVVSNRQSVGRYAYYSMLSVFYGFVWKVNI